MNDGHMRICQGCGNEFGSRKQPEQCPACGSTQIEPPAGIEAQPEPQDGSEPIPDDTLDETIQQQFDGKGLLPEDNLQDRTTPILSNSISLVIDMYEAANLEPTIDYKGKLKFTEQRRYAYRLIIKPLEPQHEPARNDQ